jgi:hypothetical protein
MPIQQINHGATQGYQVRVGPRHASLTKFFAIKKHGGPRKALARARQAEADLLLQAEPLAPRDGPRAKPGANNTSGVVGIRPRYAVFSETPYLYFVVSWSEAGRARCTSFSAEKHGLLGALKLALERRASATGTPHELTPRQAWRRMKHLVVERG